MTTAAYYAKNCEKIKAKRREYYAAHRDESIAYTQAYYRSNKARICSDPRKRERAAKFRSEHKERLNADARVRYASRPDERAAINKRWKERNGDRVREANSAHRAANGHLYVAHCAKRRASKIKATPLWADMELIGLIYHEARHRGMSVDHIVPLRSKLVCGLHVHNNLQLLDVAKNSSKGNRFVPEVVWHA